MSHGNALELEAGFCHLSDPTLGPFLLIFSQGIAQSACGHVLRARNSVFGFSRCRILVRAPIYKDRFRAFTCGNRCVLVIGLANYWEGPATLVVVLTFSREGPLKCLLGDPRSPGTRILGPSYQRRRPRPPISCFFGGLGWFWVVLGWAHLGPGVGPDGFNGGPEGGSQMVLGSRTGARTTRFRPWAHKFTLWGI